MTGTPGESENIINQKWQLVVNCGEHKKYLL
jgi:hypothetical protein